MRWRNISGAVQCPKHKLLAELWIGVKCNFPYTTHLAVSHHTSCAFIKSLSVFLLKDSVTMVGMICSCHAVCSIKRVPDHPDPHGSWIFIIHATLQQDMFDSLAYANGRLIYITSFLISDYLEGLCCWNADCGKGICCSDAGSDVSAWQVDGVTCYWYAYKSWYTSWYLMNLIFSVPWRPHNHWIIARLAWNSWNALSRVIILIHCDLDHAGKGVVNTWVEVKVSLKHRWWIALLLYVCVFIFFISDIICLYLSNGFLTCLGTCCNLVHLVWPQRAVGEHCRLKNIMGASCAFI